MGQREAEATKPPDHQGKRYAQQNEHGPLAPGEEPLRLDDRLDELQFFGKKGERRLAEWCDDKAPCRDGAGCIDDQAGKGTGEKEETDKTQSEANHYCTLGCAKLRRHPCTRRPSRRQQKKVVVNKYILHRATTIGRGICLRERQGLYVVYSRHG